MATYMTDLLNDDLIAALKKHVPDNYEIDSSYNDGNSFDTGEGEALQIIISIGSRLELENDKPEFLTANPTH